MAFKKVAGIDTDKGCAAISKVSGSDVTVEVFKDFMGKSLDEIIKDLHVIERTVVVGIGGSQTYMKIMKLPADLDNRAVAETIKWQLTDIVGDRIVRHYITGKTSEYLCTLVGGVNKDEVQHVRAGVIDLRVAALWRGAMHFLKEDNNGPKVVVEKSNSGCRIVGGNGFLSFARELADDSDAEIQRTLLYCRSELGENIKVYYVGSDLPDETTAVGLSLHYYSEPRFNFLVKEKRSLNGIAIGSQFLKIAAASFILALLPYIAVLGYGIQTNIYTKRTDALAPQVQRYNTLKNECKKYQDWAVITESFKVSPGYPYMEDIRHAVPSKCWLTAMNAVSTDKNASGTSTNNAQASNAGSGTAAKNAQTKIIDKASQIDLEGYSLDAASVGLMRDNLAALPWCSEVKAVSLQWDDKVGAYKFKLSVGIKQSQAGDKK